MCSFTDPCKGHLSVLTYTGDCSVAWVVHPTSIMTLGLLTWMNMVVSTSPYQWSVNKQLDHSICSCFVLLCLVICRLSLTSNLKWSPPSDVFSSLSIFRCVLALGTAMSSLSSMSVTSCHISHTLPHKGLLAITRITNVRTMDLLNVRGSRKTKGCRLQK